MANKAVIDKGWTMAELVIRTGNNIASRKGGENGLAVGILLATNYTG